MKGDRSGRNPPVRTKVGVVAALFLAAAGVGALVARLAERGDVERDVVVEKVVTTHRRIARPRRAHRPGDLGHRRPRRLRATPRRSLMDRGRASSLSPLGSRVRRASPSRRWSGVDPDLRGDAGRAGMEHEQGARAGHVAARGRGCATPSGRRRPPTPRSRSSSQTTRRSRTCSPGSNRLTEGFSPRAAPSSRRSATPAMSTRPSTPFRMTRASPPTGRPSRRSPARSRSTARSPEVACSTLPTPPTSFGSCAASPRRSDGEPGRRATRARHRWHSREVGTQRQR